MVNIEQELEKLYIDEVIKNNPSYESAVVSYIKIFIDQITNGSENVFVSSNDNKINIRCSDSKFRDASISVSEDGKKIIASSKSNADSTMFGREEEYQRLAIALDNVDNINIEYLLRTQDVDKFKNSTDLYSTSYKSQYSKDGIEMLNEKVSSKNHFANIGDYLHTDNLHDKYINSFGNSRLSEQLVSMHSLRRNYADVAFERYMDNKGRVYRSMSPISTELGTLKYLRTSNDLEEMMQPHQIGMLTDYSIEQSLNKESNERVRNGLRKLFEGRNVYIYDSEVDSSYINNNKQRELDEMLMEEKKEIEQNTINHSI